MNQLYLICADSADGENMDLFVRATTPKRALHYWRTYYKEWNFDESDLRVCLVPSNIGRGGAIAWNNVEVVMEGQ